ncbi:MAG: heme exporter protein CcmD, partial [Pseudomonadota bacterium]
EDTDGDPRAAACRPTDAGGFGVMPDLGDYAGPVLLAYGVSLVLLGGLVVWSLVRNARVKAELARQEGREDG